MISAAEGACCRKIGRSIGVTSDASYRFLPERGRSSGHNGSGKIIVRARYDALL